MRVNAIDCRPAFVHGSFEQHRGAPEVVRGSEAVSLLERRNHGEELTREVACGNTGTESDGEPVPSRGAGGEHKDG